MYLSFTIHISHSIARFLYLSYSLSPFLSFYQSACSSCSLLPHLTLPLSIVFPRFVWHSIVFISAAATSDSSSNLPPSVHPFCSSFKIIFTCCPLLCCCACVQQGVARVFCGYFYCISFLCTYNDNFSYSSAVFFRFLFLLRCWTLAGAWKAYSDDNATTCSKGQAAEILCNILWLSTVSSGRGRDSSSLAL